MVRVMRSATASSRSRYPARCSELTKVGFLTCNSHFLHHYGGGNEEQITLWGRISSVLFLLTFRHDKAPWLQDVGKLVYYNLEPMFFGLGGVTAGNGDDVLLKS